LKVLEIVLKTLESIEARSPGFKASVALETKLPPDDLVETVKALQVTENVTTVPPSELKVLEAIEESATVVETVAGVEVASPELKVVTQETKLPPHDLVESGEAVVCVKGIYRIVATRQLCQRRNHRLLVHVDNEERSYE
jgi:hypothetical protein